MEVRRRADHRVDARLPGYLRVLGMPGPVWTMALWFAAVSVVLLLSLFIPMNADAQPSLRAGLMVYAVASMVSLVVLRDRTPLWYLHVQTGFAVIAAVWLIGASVTPEGVVTSAMSLVVVATYAGFWFTLPVALGFAAASSAGLLAVLILGPGDYYPSLAIPWILITILVFGLVLTIGLLIRHINRQLVTDPLTGLLNRAGMFSAVEARGPAEVPERPCVVVVIDLDNFKAINDREGHLAGDAALRDFADALRAVARGDDLAIRSGGDEFIVVLPGTSLTEANAVLGRLRAGTGIPWSWGASMWLDDEPFDQALARADEQMYRRKSDDGSR